MTERSRIEQRDHLMTALGMLVDPIRRLIADWPASAPAAPYVQSKFGLDFSEFIHKDVTEFCKPKNHFFESEYHLIRRTLRTMNSVFTNLSNSQPEEALKTFESVVRDTLARIREIPCDDPGTVFPAESPFQTYKRLRAVSVGVVQRLDLLDPYLDANVFHRYLAEVPPGVMLQVVTSDKVMTDTPRRDRIVAVSELVASERRDKYRFLVSTQQHDRHLRTDDAIFHLGGSAVHAGMNAPYTISNLEPSQTNHALLDGVIAGATEWYGPTVTNHRKS